MSETKSTYWELEPKQALKAVEDLLHEGNVRRVRVARDGHTLAEFPLMVGVVGAVLAPGLAALGTVAALIGRCAIQVERTEQPEPAAPNHGEMPPAEALPAENEAMVLGRSEL